MSGLLIPNTFAPKRMTPVQAYAQISSMSLVTLVSVTGSGVLTSLSMLPDIVNTNVNGYMKITIDGVAGGEMTYANTRTNHGASSLLLASAIKFNASLLIQSKVSGDSMKALATYLLD